MVKIGRGYVDQIINTRCEYSDSLLYLLPDPVIDGRSVFLYPRLC